MNKTWVRILLLALASGLRSAKTVALTSGGNWKRVAIVAGLVTTVTAGDAVYSAATSTIDSLKVASFTTDCKQQAGYKVIQTVDASKISVLKLECAKDVGQEDTVVQDTGLGQWIVSNASLLLE